MNKPERVASQRFDRDSFRRCSQQRENCSESRRGGIRDDKIPFIDEAALTRFPRPVAAILGPTNTGKTHFAIERMLAHPTGIIGLPLRLLAREVYNRVVEKVGPDAVALVTGEEKVKPRAPRYWVATVEAMPRDIDPDFIAIDEIQLAADLDRGHIFTDRILNRRGREETLLIGAGTMGQPLERLVPGIPVTSRPRLSQLTFAGARKISRLPRRSAIVAFSAEEVYAIAEWIRRQRGGAAVVLGALSPRTRNAQIDLYQNGDVDYIVATDAIGMGLNLDVDHIAFASDRKFDGWHYRRLTPAEFGQIAGRAGRHVRDGTFGSTGRCPPFDEELVEQIEQHRFAPVSMLQWRSTDLDFATIASLQHSLDTLPQRPGLTRAPIAVDQLVLDIAAHDEAVVRQAAVPADVARLWEVCQIPDYRKISPGAHAELVLQIFGFVVRRGRIPDDWFARQIAQVDRTDGEIDALSARIAQVRTWTYIANRPDWLIDPEHWQGIARRVEDSLSDALHERLTQRFIDRRTSLLMRRLRENAMLQTEITATGDVLVEGQHVGTMQGFRFTPDPQAEGEAARTLAAAAESAVATEIENRVTRVGDAVDDAFVLSHDGTIRWLGEPVGKIAPGEKILTPRALPVADERLTGPSLEKVQARLDLWLAQHVKKLLGPLFVLEEGEGLTGISRGIAFRVAEELGVLERAKIANDVRTLPQDGRAALRKLGVRFGAYHVFLPALVKPAARALSAQLWSLKHGGEDAARALTDVAHLATSGRTSFVADTTIPKALYRAAGFRVSGERAVRVDILERLADLIRPAVAYRPGTTPGDPPPGTADGNGFVVTVGMTSLAGCSGEQFASILKSLGYAPESRNGPAITVALVPKAATVPVAAPMEAVDGVEAVASSDETVSEEASAAEATDDADLLGAVEPDPVAIPESAEGAEANEEADAPAELVAQEETPSVDAVVEEAPAADPVIEDVQPEPEVQATEDVSPAEAIDAEIAAHEAAAIEIAPGEIATEPVAVEGEEPAADAPVEPALIEVWHPAKPHNERRQHHRPKKKEPAVLWTRKEPPPKPVETPDNAEARPPQRRPDNRPDRPRFDKPKRHGERFGDRHNGPPREFTSRPPKKERGPDPDSPFAKLAALKAELEKKG